MTPDPRIEAASMSLWEDLVGSGIGRNDCTEIATNVLAAADAVDPARAELGRALSALAAIVEKLPSWAMGMHRLRRHRLRQALRRMRFRGCSWGVGRPRMNAFIERLDGTPLQAASIGPRVNAAALSIIEDCAKWNCARKNWWHQPDCGRCTSCRARSFMSDFGVLGAEQ